MVVDGFYIGVDLGGTTFKAVAVSRQGKLLGRIQAATEPTREPEVVARHMAAVVDQLAAAVPPSEGRLIAVGFGIPGILDLPAGIVRRSPNLRRWEGASARALLQAHLSVPFTIDNDANAAVLGELWLGTGQGRQHVVMLTLGTGVGGGVVIDGAILHGANGYGGEIGHTIVEPNGPRCGCGSQGCLEQFASATAIVRMAASHYGETTAVAVAQAAQRGEGPAQKVFEQVGYYLGIACSSFAHLFNPQRIVIGGAVAGAFDLFIGPLRHTMQRRTFVEVYDHLDIVAATCGNDAGGLGAAYQAMQTVAPA